jgi:hypothetical protein
MLRATDHWALLDIKQNSERRTFSGKKGVLKLSIRKHHEDKGARPTKIKDFRGVNQGHLQPGVGLSAWHSGQEEKKRSSFWSIASSSNVFKSRCRALM